MKKRIALIALMLFLLLPACLFTALNTASGSRWLLQSVFSALPAHTSVAEIQGSLLDHISLRQVHYQTPTESITIARIDLNWQPSQLLAGRLKIVDISLDSVDIIIKPSEPSEPAGFDWGADIPLPLQLILENLTITNLHYQDGETKMELQYLTVSALTEANQLKLASLTLTAEPLSVQASGVVTLGKQFPLNIKVNWQLETEESGRWQADTIIDGGANHLQFTSRQSSPFKLDLQGDLENLQTNPAINAHGDWQQLTWPFAGAEPRISSDHGHFEIHGPMNDYHLTLAAPLTQEYLPNAQLRFTGQGSMEAANIELLQIASDAGALRLDGRVNWRDVIAFELNAHGQNFNPAIFLPELPGQLTFDTRLKGDDSQLRIDLGELSGQLRKNPVEARGQFVLANDTIAIDGFFIRSGRNRIDADGKLGAADSNLKFNIDAPVLDSLWPGLAGSFKSDGDIRGNWQKPAVRLKAKGTGLRFLEQRIGKLAIDIDYQADTDKASHLQLDVSDIKTGSQTIDSVTVVGRGRPTQHRIDLDLRSTIASLSSSLTGELNAGNWLGNLNKLRIEHPPTGAWQLRDQAKLQVSAQDAGLNAKLSKTCIARQSASMCLYGDYQASGDFALQLQAASLPTELLQAYLSDLWQLKGILNADIDLRQKNGSLAGNYSMDMPARSKLILNDATTRREWELGKLAINGQLQNTQFTTDADLRLLRNDYLRARVISSTTSAGPLSGRIDASINEWTLLQPFIPKASELKGHLLADLTLHGSIAAPGLAGNLNLTDGAIVLKEAGIALQNMDLHAQTSKATGTRIQLDGAFTPILLSDANTSYQRQFDGRLHLTADLEQKQQQWLGSYRLTLPANSRLSLKTPESQITLPFATSSLSGDIGADVMSAHLDLQMLNQDYLRARVEVATGPSNSLTGQINASIKDLNLFNALMPELSNMQGLIKTDLTIQGTTKQPAAIGSIQLEHASTDIASLGISVREANLHIVSAGDYANRLQLSGSAMSGDGVLKINGFTDLKGNADITLQGQDFEIAKLPEAQIDISPNLEAKLSPTSRKIRGKLEIAKAIIAMPELPENAVVVSEDEEILGKAKPENRPVTQVDLDADIDVDLGKKASFSGQGLTTDLEGRLKMIKTGAQTSLHGSIDMKNGRYRSYGQDLTIRKGRFVFSGPIDAPWLDVEATRLSKSQDVTAILSLNGPLKSPKTRIYSEPSLPESEALAYLITGSPLNQVGKSDGNMVASAALSYGAGHLSWLTDKFGIDEFEVKQGKTLQDTLVAVGEYLTPDFYVGTKLGIFNKQAVLVLKHKLTKSLNVETQSGTSQRIKLNYEIDTD